jgi:hypothetical protein
MKSYSKLILAIFLFSQCRGDECVNSDRCNLNPDAGPCYALITKYYYDKTTKKCQPFMWGGCAGVVPFDSLEECEKGCSCE